MEKDEFLTINNTGKGIYKEKGSKFYGFIFAVSNEEQAKQKLEEIKSEFHDARHHCYAYRLGTGGEIHRMNDDGDPSSTAGKPIYGQILAHNLTNVMIIVVRYFGGTKLGTSGLIRAYKTASEEAINNTQIVKKTICELYTINFNYNLMNDVMKIIHDEIIEPVEKNFEASCSFTLAIRKTKENSIVNRFDKINGLIISKLDKKIYS